jgi:hypothetical protein
MGKYFRWEKHSRNEIALNPPSTISGFFSKEIAKAVQGYIYSTRLKDFRLF